MVALFGQFQSYIQNPSNNIQNMTDYQQYYLIYLHLHQHQFIYISLFQIGILLNCTNSTVCITCSAHYYYYDNTTNKCRDCPANCYTCSNSISCEVCDYSGYYLNKYTKSCDICDSSCFTCINSTDCSSCSYGQFLNTSIHPYRCFKCKQGFQPNRDWICQQTPQINQIHQINHSILIGIIVACILAPVLVSIGIYLYCKKRIINKRPQIQILPLQIQIKPPQIQISQIRIKNKFDVFDDCSICLENECDLITNCNHSFHWKCLKEWKLKRKYCPNCRNVDLSRISICICLKCNDEQVIVDIFDADFLENVEKSRKGHKCKKHE